MSEKMEEALKQNQAESPPKEKVSQEEVERLKASLEEQKKIAEEKEKLAKDYLNDLKRVKAEFDNFRKREMIYRQNFLKTANRDLIIKLLPILDDIERALVESKKHGETGAIIEGFELIYRKFLTILEKEGVKQIESIGKKFDPKYHEAVATVSDKNREDYEIVEEIRKGYLMNEEVLRPAQVKVNRISEDKFA